jgi:NAD(P)-dependent dehydrogenase (short-subunit alcohol dehydrogenase family)
MSIPTKAPRTAGISLAGRRALVTGGEQAYGRALLAGLRDAGAEAEPLALTDTSPVGVQAAFAAGVEALGGLDAVVHAWLDPALLTIRPLLETSSSVWEEGCEAALRTALAVLQSSHQHLRERGGRIILVTPTLSTSGEAGLVPLATAAEAIRILGKSAAKQWGRHGITVNSLAPGFDALSEGVPSDRAHVSAATSVSIGEAALPDYDAHRDVGLVVSYLASEAAAHLTAATLRVDGGVWTAG